MATNEIFKHGQYLDYEVGEVRSGTPVKIGILNGVALTDSGGSKSAVDGRPSGGVGNKEDRATVAHVGAFAVPVNNGTKTPKAGDPVYWDAEGKYLVLETDTSSGVFGAVAPTSSTKAGHLVVHVSQFNLEVV